MNLPDPEYSVSTDKCLRCGACSTLAPGLIAMGDRTAIIVRQPATQEERAAADAALFNCPVLAIKKRSGGAS
jgi:ferredoxin